MTEKGCIHSMSSSFPASTLKFNAPCYDRTYICKRFDVRLFCFEFQIVNISTLTWLNTEYLQKIP